MFLGEYGATSLDGSDRKPVAVEPGQERTGLEFRVIPRGTIAGSVVDPDGEPVRRARILFTQVNPYGASMVTSASNDYTNDRGEFRLYDLYPGTYFVRAVPPPQVRACCSPEAAMADQHRPAAALLPAYYPSSAEEATAAGVAVAPGQEVGAVRITLREAPVYRVRGKITGLPEGLPLADLSLLAFPKDAPITIEGSVLNVLAERAGNPRTIAASGEFEISGLEPGDYTIAALRLNSQDRGPFGRAEVTVTDHDVKDVILRLGNSFKLAGVIRVEGQEQAQFEGGVMLYPLDGYLGHTPNARADSSGHWQIDAVLPGLYRLAISTRLKNWYVKSLQWRAVPKMEDVLQTGFEVNESTAGATLEAVLAIDGGAVSGVLKSGDQPAPKKWLDLVPDGPDPDRSPNWKTMQAGDDGRFNFTGVAPGDYRLYAWDDTYAGVGMRFDAAFRKRWENRGVKVSVPLGQTVQVELKVIAPK